MLNLFQDLFIRMFVIVGVWDFILYWLLTKGQISVPMMILIFIVEMIVITISRIEEYDISMALESVRPQTDAFLDIQIPTTI